MPVLFCMHLVYALRGHEPFTTLGIFVVHVSTTQLWHSKKNVNLVLLLIFLSSQVQTVFICHSALYIIGIKQIFLPTGRKPSD